MKTIVGGIVILLSFTSIDIIEIKLFNVPPRYEYESSVYYSLRYFKTQLYDVYGCKVVNYINPKVYPKIEYNIVTKTKINNIAELAEKYCK